MNSRFSTSLFVAFVLTSVVGMGMRPAHAASLRCRDIVDVGIPKAINIRFSTIRLTCFRFYIQPGLPRLRITLKPSQASYGVYLGVTPSSSNNIQIDTSRRSIAQVNKGTKVPFQPRSLTPGYLILALDPASGGAEGDIISVWTEIPRPSAAPAPSSSGSASSVSSPVGTEVTVDLSPVSVVQIKLGKAEPPASAVQPPPAAAPIEVVVPAAPAPVEPAAPVEPVEPAPPAAEIEPTAPPPPAQPPASAPQPQPAANTSSGDSFPCSRAGIGASNLCIEQPYPVPQGGTAYAVWNILDFSYGEFDRGDGQGYKGPIYGQQRVEVPGIDAPRTIRLRWIDKSGAERVDTFTIQVVN